MTGAQRFVLFGCLLQGVLCSQWSVRMPQNIEALNGSCVLIPCSFQIPSNMDKKLSITVKGIWNKGTENGETVIDSSASQQKKKIRGVIIGDLHKKNCTTMLYKKWPKRLYFRIQDELVQYTFPTLIQINTTDSPANPQITPDKVRVKEGDTVSLSCSAAAPCPTLPPTLTWTPRPDDSVSVTEVQEKEDKTKYVSSVLNFTASYLHHNKEMNCSAVYSLEMSSSEKTSQNSLVLDVQYSPKETSVSSSPSGSLLEGDSVTLTCSSKANPAVKNYIWYKVTDSGNKTVGSGQELTVNVSRGGTQYYCGAQNEHGTENSAVVILHVTYPPQISPPWSCNRTIKEISCSCESQGNPSPTIEWHLSEQLLINSTDRIIMEEHLGTTGMRSSITIHQKQGDTRTLFCLSHNSLGSFGVHIYIPPSESNSGLIHKVPFLLTGAAAGAVGVMIVCILFQLILCFSRRRTRQKHSIRMEDSAKELRVIDQSPSQDGEQLYTNNAMLSGDTGVIGVADEEDGEGPTTLHYKNTDFSSIQSNRKERGARVIWGGSQTTDYAEIRHKPLNDDGVKKCKIALQDEEGEYAEVLVTRAGAPGEGKKGSGSV